MNGVLLKVNRFVMWADLREFDDGLRLRLTLDDWQQLNFARDQRIQVAFPKKSRVGKEARRAERWMANFDDYSENTL